MTEAIAAAPAAAPAASPAAAPAAAPPPPAGHGIAWLPADADAELIGHVQNKGWGSAADAAKAHREAEKLIGADRAGRTVVLPADENDQPGWQKVYERIGRPANAADYKLAVPEGGDPAFATAASAKFHELGIPLKAGQQLAAWWNEQSGAMGQQLATAEADALQAEDAQLTKEWGSERQARTEIARRGMRALATKAGLDEAATTKSLELIEKGAGMRGVMKMMALVGDLMREGGAEGIGTPGAFGMTPEGAQAKKTQLMADSDWRGKAMKSGSAEWAELTRLNGIIAASQG